MSIKNLQILLGVIGVFSTLTLSAQNPIIRDQFSADPTAREFNGRIYLYPSHDIIAPAIPSLRKNWFCMADYHVFSSDNLVDWKDHGVILSQTNVPWANPIGYSMWAPDCVYKNGKYYFYYPTLPDSTYGKGFGIGVAVSDHPEGPFVPLAKPIANVHGIDPNVFITKDGQAYLYWSMGNIYGAKLKDNMVELDSEPVILKDLPSKGLKEGSFLFERNGQYYLTFPHVEHATERLEYAMGKDPLGPFQMTGVIMDESASGCWTNHHSFVQFHQQWYLFYHDNDYSPKFDKNRSVRVDSLSFNSDGTIVKVKPTFRGVGLTPAKSFIQIDRYSQISGPEVRIQFLDSIQPFLGWKTVFSKSGSWIKYNAVDFGKGNFKSLEIRVKAIEGGKLLLKTDGGKGKSQTILIIPKNADWQIVKTSFSKECKGNQNIVLSAESPNLMEIDWIKFE